MFCPEPISFAAILRSYIPTILTIAVSLITVVISFPSDGMIFLIACGAIIFLKIVKFESPSAIPASFCPGSTDKIPPRIISEVYAAEFNPNAITAVIISGKSRIAKITKNIIKSCKAIGVPRITATYKLQINFGILFHFEGFAV